MSDTVDRTFAVGEHPEISVHGVAGAIIVRTAPGNEINVRAEKSGSEEAKRNTQIDLLQEGDRVTVVTRKSESGLLGALRGDRMASVRYEVTVPPETEVHVASVSADVDVDGTRGDLEIQTVSGEVRLRDLAGDCRTTTVSGSIEVRSLSGTLGAHTTSGNVHVVSSVLDTFRLNTVSGDLAIDTPLENGRHYFARTVSGDLHLTVPADTGATIQMHTVSGRTTTDLPAEVIRSGRRHWQGRINGGGATVEMESVSGDLRVLAGVDRAGTQRTAAGRPVEELASDPPTVILQQLEQGEIDVDEALRRLGSAR